MKLLIVTASQDTQNWKTISRKLADIQKTLNTVKNCKLEVSLTERELKPEVVNGRITHKWFDWFSFPFYENGYDFVILHFSGAQKKEWGIDPKLGGSSHTNDGDLVGEAWFWADEKSTRKGQIRFVETCLHEISHLIAKGTGVPDMTHTEDAKKGTVEKLFKTYDMSLYLKKEKELNFLQKQLKKLKSVLVAEQLSLPVKSFDTVSQHFLVPNNIYKSKVHNGTDWPLPIGTPIYAPYNGYISEVFNNHKSLGNACHFHFNFKGQDYSMRVLHLSKVPVIKTYLKGEVIGYSGNTGMSTGPHVHIDVFEGKAINTALITTKQGVIDNLIDPYKFFKGLLV